MNNTWLQYAAESNRFKQTYLQGFLDVSGNTIVRNGSLSVKNGNVLIPHGDISMNGNIICSGSIELGATAGSGYKMVINGNTRVKNSLTVDNDASVMSSLGVGKVANDSYPLDVSGATRLSSNLTVGGSATVGSMIAGSSRFNGSVGIGADVDPNYALYTNGQFRSTGLSTFDQAIAVGSGIDVEAGELQGSTLFVKVPITSTVANHVIMDVPNNLYTSTDDANHAQVNKLEIDTKNRVIKPYRNYEGVLVTDAADGWDLGAPGAYSFDHVYGRSLEVSKNVGIGKDSDATYAIDVSGASRLSSNLTVGGAATLASITDVTGTSKFSGHVGFGKVADGTHAVDVSGSTRVSGVAFVDTSVVIGQSEPSTAALHVKMPYNLDVSNSVVFEVPNVIYKSTSSTNPSQTNYLEIDTKTRSIKPYAKEGDTLLNSTATGWDLGGPGANRFNTIYGRDLQISTNTIKIEDDSGNQISMGFDAKTGAVNYTVTTISGEVFLIKGVQTQKISSGAGTIDPSMLEFTGLSFGDTFVTNDVYSFGSAFTYNLGTTTYTGNGTDFTTTSTEQSLNSFVTGTNLTTLLARITSGDSVVIKVGATDGRTAHLEGIDVEGSLVSLSNKIISVHKQGATIKWTLWNSDAYQSSAGNFLHYIELKNINMASGTYFVAKTAGTLTYNITDTHFMSSGDLAPVNGDLYLYIERGPGNNWTKIPVSLPQSGSIQTQHLADSAVTTAKLANNSVTGDKLAGGSISGTKITDNSITGAKIADSNVTSAKIADGAITGAKLADGVISSAALIANGIITGAKLVAGSVTESILGDAAVVTAKLADFVVTTSKIADSAVTADKVLDGTLTSGKFATDSITSIAIVAGAVTNAKIADNSISNEKIMDGAITASKLAAGVVTGNLLDASSVTMDKIASGAISTEKIAGLSVTSTKIAALAVTSAKLADGAITDAKLATDSVISEKIAASAVTTAKIATGAVTEDKVADGAIIGTKIAAGSISGNHFNTSAVTADKIASMAVTTAKLSDFAVTTIKIGNLAVGTEQINDAAITSAKIASGAITTALLDASAVTAEKIASGAITTAKLADSAITTAKLTASSVTTSVIADGSITTAKLAPGFTIPSSAGGGTSITTTSDISVNSISVGGKAQILNNILVTSQRMDGTSTAPFVRNGNGDWNWDLDAREWCKISGNGLVMISSAAKNNLYLWRYSDGKWVFSTNLTTRNAAFTGGNTSVNLGYKFDISYDGNMIVTTGDITGSTVNNDPSNYNRYIIFKYVNSVWYNYEVLVPSTDMVKISNISISNDGTKYILAYYNSSTNYGLKIMSAINGCLLAVVNTQSSGLDFTSFGHQLNYSGTLEIPKISFSNDCTKVIISSTGHSSNRGRVIVYNINYVNITPPTTSISVTDTTLSYGISGYKPIPLSSLTTKFRLKHKASGEYITFGMYIGRNNNINANQGYICEFVAQTDAALSSATGIGSYLLRGTNWGTNKCLTYDSTYDQAYLESYSSQYIANYAFQFFLKDGTTNEVILWNAHGGGNGKYQSYPNGDLDTAMIFRFASASTRTPTAFIIEFMPDLSSSNTVSIIGDFTGIDTTGDNSNYGRDVAISGNGTTIAFSQGIVTATTGRVKLYNYVSDNDWTLSKTIIASDNLIPNKAANYFGLSLKLNTTGTTIAIGSANYAALQGTIKLYQLINNVWTFNSVCLSTVNSSITSFGQKFAANIDLTRIVAVDPWYQASGQAYGTCYSYDFIKQNSSVSSEYGLFTRLTTDYLTVKYTTLDSTEGSDSNSGVSYSLKNTGTFLNKGNIVIYNPTTPLTPTLTFTTTGSNGITGLGPIIEFKNSGYTSVWGNSSVYDYRWKFDTYNTYQAMIFEGSYRNSGNGIVYRDQILTLNNREMCIGSGNITTPTGSGEINIAPGNNQYSGGFAKILNYSEWSAMQIGNSLRTGIRLAVHNEYAVRDLYYGMIESCNGFEIQTGIGSGLFNSSRVNTSNYTQFRRLHISSAGDVSIGGTAVAGTKLSVSGKISATGTIGSAKGILTKSVEPNPSIYSISATVTGTGTTDDMGKSITTRVFLSGDGNRMISSGRTAKKVYIYNKVSGVFNTTATEITRADTDFAKYIGLSKNGIVIAVSNGTTIWIYRWSGSAWDLQTQTLSDSTYTSNFVVNMKLSADGSKLLVVSYTSTAVNMISIYDTTTGSKIVDIGNMQTLENMDIAWVYLAMGGGVGYAENQSGDQGSIFHQYPWMKYSVELSDDTNTVIISSSNGPVTGNQYGKVVIYDVNYSTNTASRVGSFAGTGIYDYFGKRVAINQDGSVIAFSAGAFNVYNWTDLPSYTARVYVYSRTLGATSWTLGKMYRDIDAGVGLIGFGLELRLNNVGNILYICSLPSTYGGPTQDAISIGMYGNGAWGDLSSISFVPGSMSGSSIAVDNNGSFAATELRNPTPHGGRINVYTPSAPTSLILKTGMISSDRMTIDANGDIGVGTSSVTGTKMTISGNITATGSITGSSDDRLKENEVLVSNATETLLKLRPEIYDKKPNFTSTDTSTWQKETGLIAQDVWYGAPELRHLVKLGTHSDVVVCDYEPIIYPPLVPGVDVSGVEYSTVDVPFTMSSDASGNHITVDASGNQVFTDASGNYIDASGNPVPLQTAILTIDNRPLVNCVYRTISTPVYPVNIVDIPLATDIQNDPDYTALGWGDTPASVNYIGLIPYLIKSIQELKSEIVEQNARIVALENK